MGFEFTRSPPFFLESEPAGRPAPVGSRLGAPALRIGSAAFRQSGRSTGGLPGPVRSGCVPSGMAIETSAFRQFAQARMNCCAAVELQSRHQSTRGQAPGADQAHALMPKGTVGSIPTPATNLG